VLGVVKVFCGVLVFGRIAATDMPAFKTQAQVDPGIAHFHAFFANVRVGLGELDLIEMRALGHVGSSTIADATEGFEPADGIPARHRMLTAAKRSQICRGYIACTIWPFFSNTANH
jgi:hypothetical protein